MKLRIQVALATLVFSGVAFAAVDDTLVDPPAPDSYQIGYASNLLIGDSYVNLSNAGTVNGFDPAGRISANVYVFDPSEEMISCCCCVITPDGLRSLSVKQDLVSNTLTPGVPGSVVIKLLASGVTAGGTCNAAGPFFTTPPDMGVLGDPPLEPGLAAWGTTLHQNTTTGSYELNAVQFINKRLSISELRKLEQYCGFIEANGTTFGICKSCRFGGLGGAAQ